MAQRGISAKQREWLTSQLDDWRVAEIIAPDQVSRILDRYESDADGKHWHANGYQLEPPSEGKFIRGTVAGNALVQFGIEQYFVEEGQGHEYEQAVRDRKLSAEVAVDRNGNAQLKGLVIE